MDTLPVGRSVKDVLTIADDLHERGVGVRILTGKLSDKFLTAPTGEELELAPVRRWGRCGGRPGTPLVD